MVATRGQVLTANGTDGEALWYCFMRLCGDAKCSYTTVGLSCPADRSGAEFGALKAGRRSVPLDYSAMHSAMRQSHCA